jgi:hypothetical protein
LAATIVARLNEPATVDRDQLPLPLGGGSATPANETGTSL